jgi:hypothetical protein
MTGVLFGRKRFSGAVMTTTGVREGLARHNIGVRELFCHCSCSSMESLISTRRRELSLAESNSAPEGTLPSFHIHYEFQYLGLLCAAGNSDRQICFKAWCVIF